VAIKPCTVPRPKIRQCFVTIFHYRKKGENMYIIAAKVTFSQFLDYILNSHSFPPFFGGLSGKKILVFTLYPKKGELILGRDVFI